MHYAAIDIGSNAVRLLIKKQEDNGSLSKTVTLRVPLRIGQDVFTNGEISSKKAHDLEELIKAYSIVIKLYDIPPSRLRCCATAAFREAANGQDVAKRIKKKTDISINIVSGDEEAAILCHGICKGDNRTLTLVDVGGGSTEISIITRGHVFQRRSIPIGTVRILNGAAPANWHTSLAQEVQAMAYDFERASGCHILGASIVGSGGNIGKLYNLAQDRDATERVFSTRSLKALYDEMANMSIANRMERFKLKPDRADVIVHAAEIFITIADALNISQIEIPEDGLADTIIQSIIDGYSETLKK